MTKSNLMPLVKELREIKSTFLDSQYDWVVPNEILKNLVHDLRYYQIEAIEFFHLTQFSDTFKYRNINHVLFHMATGVRVIIVIEANSYVNIRSSRLLPKFKTQKINSWCAA